MTTEHSCVCPCHQENRGSDWLMSVMVGMVAANLLYHVLPEIFHEADLSWPAITAAMLAGSLLQYVLHRYLQPNKSGNQFLWFLHVHNITDGLSIGLAWLVGWEFGLTVAFGILLHDVVHKTIGFNFLRRQGDSLSRSMAKICSTLFSIAAGWLLAVWLNPEHDWAVLGGAFAAGSLAFVAMLLFQEVFGHHALVVWRPENRKKWLHFIMGAGAMIALYLIFGHWFVEHLH